MLLLIEALLLSAVTLYLLWRWGYSRRRNRETWDDVLHEILQGVRAEFPDDAEAWAESIARHMEQLWQGSHDWNDLRKAFHCARKLMEMIDHADPHYGGRSAFPDTTVLEALRRDAMLIRVTALAGMATYPFTA